MPYGACFDGRYRNPGNLFRQDRQDLQDKSPKSYPVDLVNPVKTPIVNREKRFCAVRSIAPATPTPGAPSSQGFGRDEPLVARWVGGRGSIRLGEDRIIDRQLDYWFFTCVQ